MCTDKQLKFKDTLNYLHNKGITFAGLEKITGINQTQLGHYAAGRSKPKKSTIDKIETALNAFGNELTHIKL